MQFHFKRKKRYTMDTKLAGETLQNVFQACEKEANVIPFDKLLLQQKPKTVFYTVGKWFALVMLLLTFLSPLLFHHSPLNLNSVSRECTNLTLDNHYVINGLIYMQFFGNKLAPESCYMITENGSHYTHVYYDEKKNIIAFPYYRENGNIYIIDEYGQTMHIVTSPREEP